MHFKTERTWGFTHVPDASNVSISLIVTHTCFAAKGIWSRFPSIPPPLYLFRILVSGPGLQYNQEGSQLPYRGRNEQKWADQVRENRPGYASFSAKADVQNMVQALNLSWGRSQQLVEPIPWKVRRGHRLQQTFKCMGERDFSKQLQYMCICQCSNARDNKELAATLKILLKY